MSSLWYMHVEVRETTMRNGQHSMTQRAKVAHGGCWRAAASMPPWTLEHGRATQSGSC